MIKTDIRWTQHTLFLISVWSFALMFSFVSIWLVFSLFLLPGIILSLLNINKSNERLEMASYVFVWEQKLKLGSGLEMRLWGKARWMRVLMLVPLSSSPKRRGLDSRWGLRCHILAVIPLQCHVHLCAWNLWGDQEWEPPGRERLEVIFHRMLLLWF